MEALLLPRSYLSPSIPTPTETATLKMADRSPTLTLFHHPASSSQPALLLLTHLSIPHSLIKMKSGDAGLYYPTDPSITRNDFLALNPLGQVPTLVLDSGLPNQEVITQLPAVLHYISSLRSGQGLLGTTALEQARVQESLSYISATFTSTGFTYLFRPARVVGKRQYGAVLQAVRDQGLKIVMDGLHYLESRLDDSGWAVGGHLTVVDFLLFTVCGWAGRAGIDLRTFPRVQKAVASVEAVESVREVLESEES